jgi:hypothetical protein
VNSHISRQKAVVRYGAPHVVTDLTLEAGSANRD